MFNAEYIFQVVLGYSFLSKTFGNIINFHHTNSHHSITSARGINVIFIKYF